VALLGRGCVFNMQRPFRHGRMTERWCWRRRLQGQWGRRAGGEGTGAIDGGGAGWRHEDAGYQDPGRP